MCLCEVKRGLHYASMLRQDGKLRRVRERSGRCMPSNDFESEIKDQAVRVNDRTKRHRVRDEAE